MARARNLKPGFFKNEGLGELDPLARLLFAGLWTIADREGRLEDRPRRIKTEVLPYDDCDVDALLDALTDGGFIIRYEQDGHRYLQVVTWKSHQQPHIKEPASKIPAPDLTGADRVQEPVKYQTRTGQESPHPSSGIPHPESPPYNPPPQGEGVSVAEQNFQDFFGEFWELYPKKVQKQATERAARKIAVRDRDDVVTATGHYVASSRVKRGYCKDPPGFLKDGFWKDYVNGPIIEESKVNGQGNKATNGHERLDQQQGRRLTEIRHRRKAGST